MEVMNMDSIVYVTYLLLVVFLCWGLKIYGRKEWNTGFLSLSQTKALQGFCAICIMLHHISQKTCAPWLKSQYIVHGLDVFVTIGYFFVGIFLFCSGYGLYKSYKEKTNYLQGFFKRRMLPLIIAFCSTDIVFAVVRRLMGEKTGLPSSLFQLSGPNFANPYAWYVIAILILYLGFYLAFRFFKSEKTAILFICIVELVYIIHCDWWMYGGWWYNSVPVFIIGILFSRHEDTIVKELRKRYVLYLILTFCLAMAFHILSENTQEVLSCFGKYYNYGIDRWVRLLSQMVACCSFVIFVLLLGMKIKIGNKVLALMGTITLEFYLIHGLFIQLFGYCFVMNSKEPLYYIRNVALFVLVVLILSIPSALFLKKFDAWIVDLLIRSKIVVTVFLRDVKKLVVVLLAIVFGVTIIMFIIGRNRSDDMSKTVATYIEDNITYADVDGKKMATYVTGEGKHTIVLLRGLYDPCPTITLKPIADELAKKNRVIILDYFGSGFSDDTDKERLADNFVYEIHTALQSLGEEGPYILMPHDISGIYAQLYYDTYPQEVEAIIGINPSVSKQLQEFLQSARMSSGDYKRRMKKEAGLHYLVQRSLSKSGYVEIQWPAYESIFDFILTRTESSVLHEVFVNKFYSKNSVAEMRCNYENFNKTINRKYAEDIPVLMMLAGRSYTRNSLQMTIFRK